MQDIAFGFKSTNLFHVRDVPGCAAAARFVEEHVHTRLMQTAGGVHHRSTQELFSTAFDGEPTLNSGRFSTQTGQPGSLLEAAQLCGSAEYLHLNVIILSCTYHLMHMNAC